MSGGAPKARGRAGVPSGARAFGLVNIKGTKKYMPFIIRDRYPAFGEGRTSWTVESKFAEFCSFHTIWIMGPTSPFAEQ